MHLDKPPVEEVGIDLQFDPSPQKQSWDLRVASPFVEQFKESLPEWKFAQVEEIQIKKRSPEGIPQELSGCVRLDHVIVHDKNETRFLRVGDDIMSYRIGRCGSDYPGFDSFLKEALEKYRAYILHFQPTATRRARLRYVDVIRIPKRNDGSIKLEDYFQIGVDVPDTPFGPVGKFTVQCVFPEDRSGNALQLDFYNTRAENNNTSCFIMEWHSICENIHSLSEEILSKKMQEAHEHMDECFRASFTPKGMSLFHNDLTEISSK